MRKINAVVNSMQRRIRAVINARGGHTRYLLAVISISQYGGGTFKAALTVN